MQTKTKHTEPPWRVEYDRAGKPYIAVGPENDPTCIASEFGYGPDDAYGPSEDFDDAPQANARFIVEACNAHADLVAAVEQMLPIVNAHRKYALGEGDVEAHFARALLAKVKGGAP